MSVSTLKQKPDNYQNYKYLRKQIGKWNTEILLHSHLGIQEDKLLQCLGSGGCKKAYQLESEKALLLPNMDSDPIDHVASRWERIVDEEVAVSKLLSRIGILSPSSERVEISPKAGDCNGTIPAYVSTSFKSFSKSNIFIIDRKDHRSSTWNRNSDSFFNPGEDRLDKDKWDQLIDPMLNDLAKVLAHGLPTTIDSMNLAIVQKNTGETSKSYQIRIFGFDFTSKRDPLSLQSTGNCEVKTSQVKGALEGLLTTLFCYEFDWGFPRGNDNKEPSAFMQSLVEAYTHEVVARAQQYSSGIQSTLLQDL